MEKNREQKDFPGYGIIAGVDEAGRGPLAGPLVVVAVILKIDFFNIHLNDSKKLSEKKRIILDEYIRNNCIDYNIQIISVQDIDRLNILQATLLGMQLAVKGLKVKPDLVLIDGNIIPSDLFINSKAIVKGDSIYPSIAAASVLAKVARDQLMYELDKLFPAYNFQQHKGYPTAEHWKLLLRHGVSEVHRKSFKPVRDILAMRD